MQKPFAKPLAEFFGTFILVFFGCGVVHTATLYSAQVGLWQIAVVWGLAVMFGIYVSGAVSGGHLNPAMTLAFAVHRQMPFRDIVPYWFGQFSGAFCAAALLYAMFSPSIKAFEEAEGLEPRSIVTARCYGEYYSSPHTVPDADWQNHRHWEQKVPMYSAFLGEAVG